MKYWVLSACIGCLFALIMAPCHCKTDLKNALLKLKENPTNVRCITAAGTALEEAGNYKDAVDYFMKCVLIEPDNSYHYVRVGTCLLKMKRPDRARAFLTNALAVFEGNGRLYALLASAEYKLGDFKAAAADYENALKCSGGFGGSGRDGAEYLYTQAAKCWLELRDYARAEEYINLAVRKKADFWAYYTLSDIKERNNDLAGAINSCWKSRPMAAAFQKDMAVKRLAYLYFTLGMRLKSANQTKESRQYFERILNDAEMKNTAYGEKAVFWLKRLPL